MVLNTGSRTDIPAYYSAWFYNRIRAGFVQVRNPYYPSQVTRYRLDPQVIDAMVFCTKNPAPMFGNFELLAPYSMFWFVTITPYGREIEPFVPDQERVMDDFLRLSEKVGAGRMSWRYDPIFIDETYTVEKHIRRFESMAGRLRGGTRQCVVSFIDLYEKTKRNMPSVRAVTKEEQRALIAAFSEIARQNGLQIHLCCERADLANDHVDAEGCLSRKVLEEAIGCRLRVPGRPGARQACNCLLGADIGAYNTCGHGCLYCYANADREIVRRNRRLHDPNSPFLIGGPEEGDVIHEAKQVSWRDEQLNVFDILKE